MLLGGSPGTESGSSGFILGVCGDLAFRLPPGSHRLAMQSDTAGLRVPEVAEGRGFGRRCSFKHEEANHTYQRRASVLSFSHPTYPERCDFFLSHQKA